MKIRLYIDEDAMSHRLVRELQMRGFDVATALSENRIARDDRDHLQHASSQGRALYSYNVSDYYRLHTEFLTQGIEHAGIILAPQQRFNLGEQIRCLLCILAVRSAEDLRNRIEFLSSWK